MTKLTEQEIEQKAVRSVEYTLKTLERIIKKLIKNKLINEEEEKEIIKVLLKARNNHTINQINIKE